MASGEIGVTCPNCANRVVLPIAAIKRDNFYCSKCCQKIPLGQIRTAPLDDSAQRQTARPKKSSRAYRR
jgi:endogenous inhibitor of DNA gyrase (YacG/DUF329 family)